MSISTIESGFEYQAEIILNDALKGVIGISNLDVELFQDEIWKDRIAILIGRKFMERLSEYSGDEVYDKVRKNV